MAKRKCKYGNLASPTKTRKCKKKPSKGGAKRRKSSGGRKRAGGKQCKNIKLNCRMVRPGYPKICVVSVSGEKPRTMTSTKAGAFVSKVKKALIKRGCSPQISGS